MSGLSGSEARTATGTSPGSTVEPSAAPSTRSGYRPAASWIPKPVQAGPSTRRSMGTAKTYPRPVGHLAPFLRRGQSRRACKQDATPAPGVSPGPRQNEASLHVLGRQGNHGLSGRSGTDAIVRRAAISVRGVGRTRRSRRTPSCYGRTLPTRFAAVGIGLRCSSWGRRVHTAEARTRTQRTWIPGGAPTAGSNSPPTPSPVRTLTATTGFTDSATTVRSTGPRRQTPRMAVSLHSLSP